MSKRYQGGVLGVGFNPLQAPNAPTIGTATAGISSASVAFTAPANVGGSAITSYAVQSTPGNIGATGSSSPITVSGLTADTAYTFRVTALNSYGPSPASAASNSVTPIAAGQTAYTAAGTYSFVVPAGITSVSVVTVGGGGTGTGGPSTRVGAGGLSYVNNISVTPGETLTVLVGAGAVPSSPTSQNPVAGGRSRLNRGGTVLADSGLWSGGVFSGRVGTGGNGGGGGIFNAAGGAGAGGYAGAGGDSGSSGSGGGGGGGGGSQFTLVGDYTNGTEYFSATAGGGGVGLLGQGSNGAGGAERVGGGAGSSGTQGGSVGQFDLNGGAAGLYGGMGGTRGNTQVYVDGEFVGGSTGNQASGGVGAVRIIWPGTSRSFPSTNTGNL